MQHSRQFNIASSLLATVFSFLAFSQKAQGQTFTVVYEFATDYSQGAGPMGGVIEDSAGNLYGANHWAPFFFGTVFKVDPTGTETTLYLFKNGTDGAYPSASVFRDSDGNLYGTTSSGGDQTCSCGTVFKLDTSNVLTTLHTFTGGTDGSFASLWFSYNGSFYGTAAGGGTGTSGVVFKIAPNGRYTALHALDGPTEGNGPGQLVRDAAGNLYGVATAGGSANAGTIFELNTTGKFTVLYSFTGGPDGAAPVGLIRNSQGVIHGVASAGGDPAFPAGTVFNLGTTGKLKVLHTFHRTEREGGLIPSAIFDLNGTLFGSTHYGGDLCAADSEPLGCGVLFQIAGNGQYSVIHRFEAADDSLDPTGRLTRLGDGNIYGTASGDGICGPICGTIFKITP